MEIASLNSKLYFSASPVLALNAPMAIGAQDQNAGNHKEDFFFIAKVDRLSLANHCRRIFHHGFPQRTWHMQ